jgi:hypothetical protein
MNDQEKGIFEKKLDDRMNSGFPYVGKNAQGGWDIPSAIASYAKFVELYICRYSGGLVSASAFEIVLREMLASGDLKAIAVEEEPEDKPVTLTAREYHAIPTRVIIRKHQTDPAFRAAVQHLINTNQI